MTLSNAVSEIQTKEELKILNPESQERVNLVTAQINELLEGNPDIQTVIKSSLDKMVTGNLRDPEKTMRIINGLYEGRDERLKHASSMERLPALKQFSAFMSGFTEKIAQINRDITLSNEANSLTRTTNEKIKGVQDTYAQIITGNHPTQTA
jgi:hypothetical protein